MIVSFDLNWFPGWQFRNNLNNPLLRNC